MNTPAPIEVIKPGRHTAMSGAVIELSESELLASAAAYDPKLHEAPLVIGHPKTDAPAYGWAKSLSFADGVMQAEPDQVDPEFAELVNAGRFKKVSGSFFHPDSPHNPVPGVYYLRHIGFLGAMPPAVKGLKSVSFAEGDEGIVEFGTGDYFAAGIFRRLREWIISQFGQETADTVIPSWEIDSIKEVAIREEVREASPYPAFSEEPTPKGDEMSAEDKARLAALEDENRQLKSSQAAQAAAARHAGHLSFAEALITSGKLLPAHKDVAVATLDFMTGQDELVEFGEGETKQPLVDGFKTLLDSLPKQVEFGEHAASEAQGDTVNFAAPGGYEVDSGALEIHNRALAYQKEHQGTGYLEAVSAVSGRKS